MNLVPEVDFFAKRNVAGSQHLEKNLPFNFTDIFAATFAKFMTLKWPKIRQICGPFASRQKGVKFFERKSRAKMLMILAPVLIFAFVKEEKSAKDKNRADCGRKEINANLIEP